MTKKRHRASGKRAKGNAKAKVNAASRPNMRSLPPAKTISKRIAQSPSSPSPTATATTTEIPPRHAKEAHAPTPDATTTSCQPKRKKALSAHQTLLQDRLTSANFRMLNEYLYTRTGSTARQLLNGDPSLFAAYHAGFSQQAARWPCNPLDDVVAYLRERAQPAREEGESEGEGERIRVVDMGCGEGRLELSLPQLNVRSFDLVAMAPHVEPADMAAVPVADAAADVVVFCLSLMGTNYGDYLREAWRILAPRGLMLVVEVASRFDAYDAAPFVAGVQRVGFRADARHPFVRPRAAGEDARAPGRKKRRKKKKGRSVESNDAPDAPGARQGSAEERPFFLKFAFHRLPSSGGGGGGDTDKRDGGKGVGSKGQGAHVDSMATCDLSHLPTLAPCVYKRR